MRAHELAYVNTSHYLTPGCSASRCTPSLAAPRHTRKHFLLRLHEAEVGILYACDVRESNRGEVKHTQLACIYLVEQSKLHA